MEATDGKGQQVNEGWLLGRGGEEEGKLDQPAVFGGVPFELIKVRLAASADESLTLALDPSPAV